MIRSILCVGTFVSALVFAAGENNTTGPQRALPPESGPLLEQAFKRAEPLLTLKDATIDRDHVIAVLCEGASAQECFEVRLEDPRKGCPGEVAGPWCVTFPAGRPPSSITSALYSALGADHGKKVWIIVEEKEIKSEQPKKSETVDPEKSETVDPESSIDLVPLALALAVMAIPLFAGVGIGCVLRGLRRRRFRTRWAAAALVLAPVVLTFLLPPHFLLLGFWDLFEATCLLGLGLLIGAHEAALRLDRRNLLLGAAAAFVVLAILELGSRLLLPPPPVFPPGREARLFRPSWDSLPNYSEVFLEGLYPDLHPDMFARRTRGARAALGRVLHVGDSMVFGLHIREDRTFPAILSELDPGIAHINAGVPCIGPDYYYLLIRSWLPRLDVDLVVLYLYTENDVRDMDAPYTWCGDGPLLTYGPYGPLPRCPQGPIWGKKARHPRLYSSAPYPLRVATDFSVFAGHLRGLFWRLEDDSLHDLELAWEHFELVLRATRDELQSRQVPLLVVLLPYRLSLESDPSAVQYHYADNNNACMLELCHRLGIPTLDAWDVFASAVRRGGSKRWFVSTPDWNPHYSEEGHELLARWLLERMEPAAGISIRRSRGRF